MTREKLVIENENSATCEILLVHIKTSLRAHKFIVRKEWNFGKFEKVIKHWRNQLSFLIVLFYLGCRGVLYF
jgi:hypothetical protein